METKLERISQLSRENPDMVFTSIGHLISTSLLKECHNKMDGNKAVGIDGITKKDYDKNLDKNIENLVDRLRKKAYKPKPARRIEIPKDNGKTRPLSIYCYEDKLVQEALKRILEAVFEPCFYDEMMGFRPNRGCHMALRKLNYMIEREKSTDNGRSLSAFRYQVIRSLHYWLNKRSQKKSYTWSGFLEMIDTAYPLARPKIYVSIYG